MHLSRENRRYEVEYLSSRRGDRGRYLDKEANVDLRLEQITSHRESQQHAVHSAKILHRLSGNRSAGSLGRS